ncbi:metallophosphoesterase [Marinobacterium sp. YM272]|uniref:metallophosphoesterase n=1 Tax=Marinobacterium sp. YM272 TaxID=3421654 RepID=UPI003D7F621F
MKTKLATAIAAVLGALVLTGCNDSDKSSEEASVCTGAEASTERLFLQQITDSSVIIKWRGDATAACIGTDANGLGNLVEATLTEGDHKEAKFDGLDADTTYYYSVGGASTAPAGQMFKTAPASGYPADDNNTRIWLVGDSGTAGYTHEDADASVPSETHYPGVAAGVRDGMHTFADASGEPIDLFLMLGDNAYNNGDDVNYQAAVFDTYPDELKRVGVWPTIGNHEMGVGFLDISKYYGEPDGTIVGYYGGVSTESDPDKYIVDGVAGTAGTYQTVPYLDIFSLPTAGEAGGVASATEQYYSFDYGNVHIVSLDSQLSGRDSTERATMKSWLESDLAAASTESDWIVVIYHHPAYSKGSNHDSDSDASTVQTIDAPQVDMRNDFVPVFQKYGVDLVLNGHAHSYERSYYLTNLFSADPVNDPTAGDSDSFVMADNSYGPGLVNEFDETDGYVVYSTAGNGGKADSGPSGLDDSTEWLNHNAMVPQQFAGSIAAQVSSGTTSSFGVAGTSTTGEHTDGLALAGSVLIDASASRLEWRMLNEDGQVLDKFVINK